jgi:hypothetical protein
VLRLLQDIARHLDVQTSVTPEQLRDLAKKTDLQSLTTGWRNSLTITCLNLEE